MQKSMDFRRKPKLARLLHRGWHLQSSSLRPDDPDRNNQGVIIMSLAKFQTVAVSLVAALFVASIFVGAAVEPVITLA
jgi:hypothetical protein